MTRKGNKGMHCGSPKANHTTVAQQNSVNCSVMDHKLTHPFPSRFSRLPLALTANPQLPWCFSKHPTSFPLKVGVAYHLVCHILSCACYFLPRCHIPSHLQLSWYIHVHARVCVCACTQHPYLLIQDQHTALCQLPYKKNQIIICSFALKYKFKPS